LAAINCDALKYLPIVRIKAATTLLTGLLFDDAGHRVIAFVSFARPQQATQ
jgi:hypothetical protein